MASASGISPCVLDGNTGRPIDDLGRFIDRQTVRNASDPWVLSSRHVRPGAADPGTALAPTTDSRLRPPWPAGRPVPARVAADPVRTQDQWTEVIPRHSGLAHGAGRPHRRHPDRTLEGRCRSSSLLLRESERGRAAGALGADGSRNSARCRFPSSANTTHGIMARAMIARQRPFIR